MVLNIVDVKEEERRRAIEIYENMNIGGVRLNTFDLIMKAMDYQNNFMDVETEAAFVEGFSLAVSLLLEALSEK